MTDTINMNSNVSEEELARLRGVLGLDDKWDITYGAVSVKIDLMEQDLMADDLPSIDIPDGMLLVGFTKCGDSKDTRYAFTKK